MKRLFSLKPNNSSDKGYTLVELIVSMTLTAFLATAVVAVMSPAGRVFKQIQTLSRAQIVADMVVDALREECADTYINDYTSVRIVDATPDANGDSAMLTSLINITDDSATSGNVLIIRKSDGYCESLYTCFAITPADYLDVKSRDYLFKNSNGITSRAIYRLFDSTGSNPLPEASQGYLHFGYYQCGRTNVTLPYSGSTKKVAWIYPAIRYDYTNPFSVGAYNGYTVKVTFKNLTFTPAPGETRNATDMKYIERPESVTAVVEIYNCSYANQATETPVYTREVLLLFAEDTTL